MKRIYYIGLGSNLGDSKELIKKAYKQVQDRIGKILRQSSFYESEPWGFEADNNFVNSVISCESDHEPQWVMQELLAIENDLGRVRSDNKNYESRKIDLDIVAIGDEVLKTNRLVIPHPQMHLRAFVLIPLQEIEPEWRHPQLEQGLEEMLDGLKDSVNIRRLDD
ncbi:MAG: 2-amino-4-hydroxy-6-hydroxymethyldihydropteridine diphosphokinase [Crocinitomicaceae bacterium]|nr:2-amino-4-hydroxy-6-hydroxymethyldihydropteridine diphosphokinase [Crocinitomicaceae bacterium]